MGTPFTNRDGQPVTLDFTHGYRAPTGGCYGLTGAWYDGGQFLPSSERPSGSVPKTEGQAAGNRDYLAPFLAAQATAQEPANAFLISWLETTYATRLPGLGRWMSTGEPVTPETRDANPDLHVLIRPEFDWRNDFAQSMHRHLTTNRRPADFTGRQLSALTDLYARAHGARRGSNRYAALCDELLQRILPEEDGNA